MMKALLLIGLLALVETRWVRSDSQLQSVNERELGEEGSQLQALLLRNLLRNLRKFDEKKDLSAENNGPDSLEDHSSEVKHEGETRWVPNDSPLQSITDGESVDKGRQYVEHDISNSPKRMQEIADRKAARIIQKTIEKLLRNLHKFDDKKDLSAENNGTDSLEDHSSEVKHEGETRWVPNDSLLQSITDGESVDKGRQYEEHVISNLLRNFHKFDEKKELSAENNGPDSLEDHSSEVKHEGETRWVPNDSPLQSITDGESVDKGSQYEEHDISNLLRSLEERPVNHEIDWDSSLRNRRLENYAKAHHINDDSPGKRSDIELLASLAQQANDAGIQRDLDEYERLAVNEGEAVSSQEFMGIQPDNQPLDESLSRY